MTRVDRVLRVASDPASTQESLAALSTHRSLAVRRAVAENPNCPLDVLLGLGMLFPKSFAENPSVPLFLMEDPEYLGQEPALLLRLLRLRSLPEFLWVEAARCREIRVRLLLADSRYTPPRILEALLQDTSSMVQRRALENPMTPSKKREDKKESRTIGDVIAEMSENLGYSPHRHSQLQRALATLPAREASILQLCFGLREDGTPKESARAHYFKDEPEDFER